MHSRSSDPFDERLTAAVERLIAAIVSMSAANPVVLIDGRSGAGKSSLASRLRDAWPLSGRVQLVALDAIYPGWDGLERGAEIARESILVPHARGSIGTWHRWDWKRHEAAEAHAVDPALGLIVEGCGALTPSSARLADVTVWVDGPAATRRRRALERDGDAFRTHWDMWASQEESHIRAHRPERLADVRVDVP
ncbi:hypothetical protein [Microbacterium sp.]|uniref:hypothetical protein n=1 Tax=Microbacterium sp. TaxID=51671 RepID=UPI0028123AAB|nr:hypothetical protein [Microbacterium sp.]